MSRSATSVQGTAGWKHFPRDVDVGVRGSGGTAADAFEQAAPPTFSLCQFSLDLGLAALNMNGRGINCLQQAWRR